MTPARKPASELAIYNPEEGGYILRTTIDDFVKENLDGLDEQEISAIKAMLVGDALSVPVGGGGFFVVVAVDPAGGYDIAYEPGDDDGAPDYSFGEFIGLHHGRPEDINYRPIS